MALYFVLQVSFVSKSHQRFSVNKRWVILLLQGLELTFQSTGPPDLCILNSTGPTKLSLAQLQNMISRRILLMFNSVMLISHAALSISVFNTEILTVAKISTKPCKLKSWASKFYRSTMAVESRFYWPDSKIHWTSVNFYPCDINYICLR